jgi:hypothetical protein
MTGKNSLKHSKMLLITYFSFCPCFVLSVNCLGNKYNISGILLPNSILFKIFPLQ